MKNLRNILVGFCIVLGWASCTNEVLPTTEIRQGTTSLSVDRETPSVTRAVETADFPVAVYTLEGDEEKVAYERADQIPDRITLPVGKYYAQAHTPGELNQVMDIPYYAGREEFEILQNINTVSTVKCRMVNGGVTVQFTEAFEALFSDCSVSVDDGSQLAIIHNVSQESGFVPMTRYLCYKENTKALYVNVSAITKEGYRSSMKYTLTKKEAYEQYDDDKDYFSGGDCIVINCDTVRIESTEGGIVGITINANIQFDESEEFFEMEVEDYIPEGEDEEDGSEDNPGSGDSDAITLDLPEDMVVSATTEPSLGDTYITTEHGIKSIGVKITSTSEGMMSALAELAVAYEGVDFVAGAEVVDNQNMIALFEGLGQSLSIPLQGDLEYTFPIGNFFVFLDVLPGDHTFTLTVTDMKGNTKNGKLVLTVK